MTDKKIIDEERMFKCVWCKYDFKESDANFILSENPNECVCSSCMTEWADNLLLGSKHKQQECEKLNEYSVGFARRCQKLELDVFHLKDKNCNLQRQLYQLKAEKEKLKKECEIWKNQVLTLDDETITVQITQQQFEEYDKLKVTIAEIKDIAENHKATSHCDYLTDMDNILQKISEVER